MVYPDNSPHFFIFFPSECFCSRFLSCGCHGDCIIISISKNFFFGTSAVSSSFDYTGSVLSFSSPLIFLLSQVTVFVSVTMLLFNSVLKICDLLFSFHVEKNPLNISCRTGGNKLDLSLSGEVLFSSSHLNDNFNW